MPTLKEVGNIGSLLENSPLSQSPLWSMPADEIVPAQLTAFRARLAIEGRADEADQAIRVMLDEMLNAATRSEIPLTEILDYIEPHSIIITSGQLRRGFKMMVSPRPAAVLFGLEARLNAVQVITLTWDKAKKLRRDGKLPPYACRILDSLPVHIQSPYVFWRSVNRKPMPLFGLEQEVFDLFGMVWGELAAAYERLILIDEKSETLRWQELLWKVN